MATLSCYSTRTSKMRSGLLICCDMDTAPSLIPSPQQREVRELTRYGTKLGEERSRVINRVQKVLEDANIKLATVASDLIGKSAHRYACKPLLQDDADPVALAELALGKMRCQSG